MEYLIYVAGGLIGISSLGLIVRPVRGKRIAYNIAYLLPFWSWGVILLIMSSLAWYSRSEAFSVISANIAFVTLFAGGLALLLFPKRKIKKALELFLALSGKRVRLIAAGTLLIALMMILSA